MQNKIGVRGTLTFSMPWQLTFSNMPHSLQDYAEAPVKDPDDIARRKTQEMDMEMQISSTSVTT